MYKEYRIDVDSMSTTWSVLNSHGEYEYSRWDGPAVTTYTNMCIKHEFYSHGMLKHTHSFGHS